MKLSDYLEAKREDHLEELLAWLRLPSVSADPEAKDAMTAAAQFVAEKLAAIGCETQVLPTGGHPAVVARLQRDPSYPTVLIYGHYDVQPPDPLEGWVSPPFEPQLVNDAIVARGASDDKGQVYAHIKGLEAALACDAAPKLNVTFLIEGEEEVGSPNLEGFVHEHKDLLAAEVILISDGAMFAPNTPTITYGLKGLAYLELCVRGASHDLHSGGYGGGVPNPIQALASMISKLKDDEGRISVPGFYDRVRELTQDERERLAATGFDERAFAEEVGLQVTPGEPGYSLLERLWARPTLDINGIGGGFQGVGAKTVIPAEARAKLSCRLVPDQEPEEIGKGLEDYLRSITPPGISLTVEVLHGARPVITATDSRAVQLVAAACERVFKRSVVFARTGGSIPVVSTFKEVLGSEVVLLGLGLENDRAHSPNEKFDLDNYYRGIALSTEVLIALQEASLGTK